jgi:hypothetical protein
MAEPLTGPLMTRYCQLAKLVNGPTHVSSRVTVATTWHLTLLRHVHRQHSIWLSLGGFQEKSKGDTADTHVHNAHVIVNDQGQVCHSFRLLLLQRRLCCEKAAGFY